MCEKKFYMTVFLVEVTTVTQLVDRLKKGKYRSSQDVLGMSESFFVSFFFFFAFLLAILMSC